MVTVFASGDVNQNFHLRFTSAMTFHDDFAKNIRTFMRDDGRIRSARIIYDDADYDLSDGVQVRNLRSAFSSEDKDGCNP